MNIEIAIEHLDNQTFNDGDAAAIKDLISGYRQVSTAKSNIDMRKVDLVVSKNKELERRNSNLAEELIRQSKINEACNKAFELSALKSDAKMKKIKGKIASILVNC